MLALFHGDYVYLDDMDETPRIYYINFIQNICPYITIMTPIMLLRKY